MTLLKSPSRSHRRIAIVDPSFGDYVALLTDPAVRPSGLHLLSCGRDALYLARTVGADLWVVNTVLPDMSGLDLCAMLGSQAVRPTIYALSEQYSQEEEQAARGNGAAVFGCKPAQDRWWRAWARPP